MLNPNVKYLRENISSNRYLLLQGSTRSGKTRAVIDFLIELCLNNSGMEIDITRETFKALKATAWRDFQKCLLDYRLYNPLNHNKTDGIYNLNGNRINYFGSDDHGKVHGKSRDILWVNEAQLADEEVIDQLFPRTRHKIICDFNPALGEEHWLDRYLELSPPFVTTYKDNPYLTDSQVEEIESKKDNPYWWSVYGEGKRAKVEGAVFTRWIEGKFEPVDYWFGLDFGYSNDPTALTRVAIEKDKLYIKEEVYETHLTTSQIFDICKGICGKSLIIADSAEPRLIAELRSKGLNIQGAKKVTINEGVMLMNDYEIIAEGKNLKKELSKYRWADKGKTVPIDDHNHCFTGDTLISTLVGEVPIKDIIEGDLVLTSSGYNKVLKKWDNGLKQTRGYSMQFDTFSLSLESTDSHRIRTEKGWTEISSLRAGQKLYLSKYFLERNINSIKVNGIFQEARRGFTELYGSITTGKYQRGMISTTLMAILQTTILKILILFREVFMQGTRVRKGLKRILSGLKSFTRRVLRKQKSGTKAKRGSNGTLNTVRNRGKIESIERLIARYVVKSIAQDTQESQNTAIITARLKHLERGEERKEKVYDLTVENEHEYFANGVLVHNCLDGARYAFMFKAMRPNYGKYSMR